MDYFFLITGLLILVAGGELLVRGAVRLAYRFHISTLVVGMTVVSFGTSAPELLVSVEAVFKGHPDIAVGNVIGSNIANIALVLGITAAIFPVWVVRNSIRFDWPMMMFSSLLVYAFMWSGHLVFWNGLVMVALLMGFSYFLIWKSRLDSKMGRRKSQQPMVFKTSIFYDIVFILLGSVFLALGAHWMVGGAVGIAHVYGVSDFVISVTIVAFGTSVPELITSVVAAFKKQTDISVGNLIGSNIFNILGILGVTAMIKPIPINQHVLDHDMLWVLGVSFVMFPMMVFRKKITRLEGMALFMIYVIYLLTLRYGI